MRVSGLWVRAVIFESLASGLALAIYIADNGQGALAMAALLAAANAMVLLVGKLVEINRNAYTAKLEGENKADFFGRALYRIALGMPRMKALEESAGEIAYAKLRHDVRTSLKKHALGGGEDRDFAGVSSHPQDNADARDTEAGDSVQRYATFSMFVSTVLPSFMVFAFIGSSILSRSPFSMLLFSALLVFAVPSFYSIGNLFMWRRLFA